MHKLHENSYAPALLFEAWHEYNTKDSLTSIINEIEEMVKK